MKLKKYYCLLLLEIIFIPSAMCYDYYECPSMDYYVPNIVIEKYCKEKYLGAYNPSSKYSQEQYNILRKRAATKRSRRLSAIRAAVNSLRLAANRARR